MITANQQKAEISEAYQQLPKSQMWINEAFFGFNQIKDSLARLSPQSKVLEVGCGSGILLNLIKMNHPNLNIHGVEPLGDGFSQLSDYHQILKDKNITLFRSSYEDLLTNDENYDFIFLINVFEHLKDWKDFLRFVSKKLNKNAQCLILCPNYSFPLESHFKVPIIFNKKITFFIFKNKILKFEKDNNCYGLWDSLNFVKFNQVEKELQGQNLDLKFDTQIIDDLINRISNDESFKERQKIIGIIANFLNKIGILSILKTKVFRGFSPYMKLSLSRRI